VRERFGIEVGGQGAGRGGAGGEQFMVEVGGEWGEVKRTLDYKLAPRGAPITQPA
jgi:hypothetical protein